MLVQYVIMPVITRDDFHFTDQWELDEKGPKQVDLTPSYVIDQTTGRRYWNENLSTLRKKACLLATVFAVPTFALTSLFALRRIAKLVSCYHFWFCMNSEKKIHAYVISNPSEKAYHGIRKKSGDFICKTSTITEETEVAVSANSVGSLAVESENPAPLPTINSLFTRKVKIREFSLKNSCCKRLISAKRELVQLVATPISLIMMEACACYGTVFPSNNARKLYQTFENVQFDCQIRLFDTLTFKAAIPQADLRGPPASMLMI